MTLVPLKFNNFVKNKINNTIKVKYKNSDLSTHIVDNNIDSKSILNTEVYRDMSTQEVNLADDDIFRNEKLTNIKKFLRSVDNINNDEYALKYFNFSEAYKNRGNQSITNENLKLFNFRNYYGIEKIRQKFLPQSF